VRRTVNVGGVVKCEGEIFVDGTSIGLTLFAVFRILRN
jgi:hypothetical protein